MSRKGSLVILTIILLLGSFLRVTVTVQEGSRFFLNSDDACYVNSGATLAQTGMLTYGDPGKPSAFLMPGYPFFLALIFKIAGSCNLLAVRLVQDFLSVVCIWLIFLLGKEMFSVGIGLLAAFITACYPPNILAPNLILTETLFSVFLYAFLFLVFRYFRLIRTPFLATGGIILSLATLVRPTAALLPGTVALIECLKRNWNKGLRAFLILQLAVVTALIPWWIRNYLHFDKFIPLTTNNGNPLLTGTYLNNSLWTPRGSAAQFWPKVPGDEAATDQALRNYAFQRIKANFRQDFWTYLNWYTIGKFKVLWWDHPFYWFSLARLPQQSVTLLHQILMICSLLGIATSLIKPGKNLPYILLILFTFLYFTLTHLVYVASSRYAFPLISLAFIFAAFFISLPFSKINN
ncbi:MAG: glycosyltransferase family 39 protein [Syntrophothermus sp.]|uniref:ArnT family glycosyltransferase n=1 Tax=Syntrophothermus sp. TaxID=2736299 RepID=UPI00257B16C5|nr:glycosyltransferase family 39 protein [Syntrophothermus sp.]NSW84653.1 glycosyltransferase family 39 protein [Syntrophothermus sp.]